MFFGQKVHYYLVYIPYSTELICDERLPSSAALLDTWWGPQWGKSKSFSNFPTIFLPTSIRVEDLKDPAQLLLGSAHHHRKLRLNTLYFFQSPFPSGILISSTLWQCNCQNYSHVLLKVHAPTVILVEHPVHRVTQDAPLCDNNHCHHFFHIINIFFAFKCFTPISSENCFFEMTPVGYFSMNLRW